MLPSNTPEVITMSPEEISEDDMVIALMGPTGTGKSTFIDLLTGQEGRRAGENLVSVTRDVEATCIIHPQSGKRVVVVDTPGFNDTFLSELEVLKILAEWLVTTFKLKIKLFGILYFHSITDSRMTGSTLQNLGLFERLCGDAACSKVVLVSTMWEDVRPGVGEQREAQLQSRFWRPMIEHGATVDRLRTAHPDEAWRVVKHLVEKSSGTLRKAIKLQVELVNLGRKLKETEAGKAVYTSLQERLAKIKNQYQTVRGLRKEALDPKLLAELDDELKWLERRIEEVKQEAAEMQPSFLRLLWDLLAEYPWESLFSFWR